MPRGEDLVPVVCPVCGGERQIKERVRLRCVRRGKTLRCRSCADKAREGGTGLKGTCRHCNFRSANRSRGLCYTCFYVPGVKDMYPSTSKYARRGVTTGGSCAPLVPTTAPPGTPEKLLVMEHRAAQGQAIFHPFDAREPGDPRPVEFMKRRSA
jgi:hypothetical protein